MRRILVLRGGALGDFIVTLPALALLHARWPAAQIELVGNATAATLAVSRGLLTAAHSQHERRWSALFSAEALPAELTAWLARFDLVLSYWPDPEGDLRRRFPLHSAQTFLSADALPTVAPAAAHYCRPLTALGVATRELLFPLAPASTGAERSAGPIIVHPGSGSPQKNWPVANWLTLLRTLEFPLHLVLGEAEIARWRDVDLPGITRLENAPLEELITHFSRCRLLLGHDSGISHLAAACGAPCLLLFGPTDPAMWAPPTPQVRTLRRGPTLDRITVEEVRHALQECCD